MNLIIINLRIPVELDGPGESGKDQYLNAASQKLGVCCEDLKIIKILSKELDLSNRERLLYKISIVVRISGIFDNLEKFPEYVERPEDIQRTGAAGKTATLKERPIIIGLGPAGMFAALALLAYGIKPVIFERGKRIEERALDVERFILNRKLDPESNIQFGEGGAGSFSDGKLFSRRDRNTGYVNRVLDTYIKFGAPEEIGYISKPHLGTDVLCRIVANMRNYILEQGGQIHYGAKMTDLLISGEKACGVIINGDQEYRSSDIYLAVGHSARDTFEMIHKNGIAVEQKPIFVGVRMEHSAQLINRIRYGNKYKDFRGIGAAAYSFNYTDRIKKRGVYTFCMCPGGEIVNASSEDAMMVLNGMSFSGRASAFSNAAIVVSCHTDDYRSTSPLAGMEFQKEIERRTFQAGGGNWAVPAQNLEDFMAGKISGSVNKNSYRMGAVAANLKTIFPKFINELLLAALNQWKQQEPLFVSRQAILFGAETRTSSPVRIKRNHNCESVNIKNLYPIGEGSGYTGGITSSAADAMKAVDMKWGRAV
ncbi:MAG: dehydrogenase [Desulfobacteraceae bacterium]|nr:MAG: dehydrogenase [Desulfobacteraceae bacterium]